MVQLTPETQRLEERFLAAVRRHHPGVKPGPGLRSALGLAIRSAREAWPELAIPAEHFVGYLGERVPDPGEPDPGLHRLNAPDLYLACGCALGLDAAFSGFERQVAGPALGAIRRAVRDPAGAADVWQEIQQQLLVARPGHLPGITGFAGRGSLVAWVRVVATRHTLRCRQGRRRECALEASVLRWVTAPGEDPERFRLREECRPEARLALAEALQALSTRERNVLRHHLIDHLSIDRIGALYRVHRATAARWIGHARERLLAVARRQLGLRLGIGPSECESVIRLLRTELAGSLEGLLRQEDGDPAVPARDRRGAPG